MTDKLTSEEVRDAFHYMFRAELPALKELVRSLPPNPIVINIGAGSGTSGLAILESREDVTLVTIDVENNDSPLGSLYSERDVMRRAGLSNLFNVRWFQMCGDSKIIGQYWDSQDVIEGGLSMVFIDGDHDYAGCSGDIEAWTPYIRPGGILAVHDYNKHLIAPTSDGPHWRAWPGVNRAVDDLLIHRYEKIVLVDSLIAFRMPG